MIEIGINKGGSIKLWHSYFKNMLLFIGIDINPECKKYEKIFKNTHILIGDQGNKEFLEKIVDKVDNIDIIIDDGGHQFHQQINSFKYLFKKLNYNGIYIVEDTHTSYDNYANIYPDNHVYGGGKNNSKTAIEFFKNLCDELTCWAFTKEHGICPSYTPKQLSWLSFIKTQGITENYLDYFRENIFSITFYDSMIVIKKKKKECPLWYLMIK